MNPVHEHCSSHNFFEKKNNFFYKNKIKSNQILIKFSKNKIFKNKIFKNKIFENKILLKTIFLMQK